MAIHHITNEMVRGKPSFTGSKAHHTLKALVQNSDNVLVAHNAKFDIDMLRREKIHVPRYICTMKLARFLDKDGVIPKYNLQYLRYFLKLNVNATPHDAYGDILVLERLEDAQARGAKIYGEVIGYGSSADAYHMAAPAVDGTGAAQAIRMALSDAELRPRDVDYINAHGTGTALNDVSETAAIKSVFGDHAYKVAVSSTKSMTGHLMGAAGAIEAIACLKALETGLIPPTINYEHPDPECDLDYVPNEARPADLRIAMSNSFGLGGHNACLIFRKFEG